MTDADKLLEIGRLRELVASFSNALLEKLIASEEKYGWKGGWAETGWMDECRLRLREHVDKGDPRDVAAYCAFLWHHNASTANGTAFADKDAEIARLEAKNVRLINYTHALGQRAEAAEAALEESRTVSDAQRERVAFLLAAGVMQHRSIEEMVSVVCGVFEQPAAEAAR